VGDGVLGENERGRREEPKWEGGREINYQVFAKKAFLSYL
jgi:hypothetical protein